MAGSRYLAAQKAAASTAAARKLLDDARGPQADGSTPATKTTATNNRKTACGTPLGSPAKGKLAGESIAADICGKDRQQTEPKACAPADLANDAAITWNDMANSAKQWETLFRACQKGNKHKYATAETLRAAVTALLVEANTGKGTDRPAQHVIGLITGTGNTGCDGANGDTNGGTCVYYGSDSGGDLAISWASKMLSAADELDKAAQAAAAARTTAAKLTDLNKTMTAIALLAAEASHKPDSKTDTNTITQSMTKCETINKAAECKNKTECKWEGGDVKEGNHFKLNETHVAEKATQTGSGGNGETKTTYKQKGN
ncbi:Trypanosomal VSG domain containing protein, putative [Trypanosoma equiperdum]|uniref:Trypanosomal VSG domain containing protein, putative n=1 Tax=Trypanosoma equiperdum TaxID=5694 RepID=A0A1G4I7E3_TRYEQ|nr:Trypanosomal VSG domain containing protein, putative [Trypanosoma equiperdum]